MPLSRIALIPVPAAAASVLFIALTGCSPTQSGSAGGGAAVSASAKAAAVTSAPAAATGPSSAAAATPAQGKLSGVPQSCPSADEVMSKLGLSKLVVSGGDPSYCTYLYNGSKADPYVAITFNAVPPSMTPASFEDQLKQAQSGVEPVADLGDAAGTFTGEGGGSGLSFLSGETICSIVSTVPTTTAGKVALATAIIAG